MNARIRRWRVLFVSGAAAGLIVAFGAGSASPHSGFLLRAFGTATVDGVLAPGEWNTAAVHVFQAAVPGGGTVPGELRVMNDSSNLYFGVRLGTTAPTTSVAFGFDNDHDGLSPEEGDDGLAFGDLVAGFDTVRSGRGGCPAGAMCGFRDPELGGTTDGAGMRTVQGGDTHFELWHPLDSTDDANDFSVRSGDLLGFGFQVAIEGVLTQPVPFGPMGDILITEPIPPDTQVAGGPADGSLTGGAATFAFIASDNVDSAAQLVFACSLDDAAFTACTSPIAYSGLSDGVHRFAVRATDRSGNLDQFPATRTWTVDTTPPETTVETGPSKLTRGRTASFSFSGTDARTAVGELRFECALDGGTPVACTSPSTLTTVGDGRHSFEVRAVDQVGNRDASAASYEWTIDATAPAKPRVRGPHQTAKRRPTYRFSSRDALTPRNKLLYLCALDSRTLRRCSSVYRPALRPGKHVLRVTSVDEARNRSAVTRFSVVMRKR